MSRRAKRGKEKQSGKHLLRMPESTLSHSLSPHRFAITLPSFALVTGSERNANAQAHIQTDEMISQIVEERVIRSSRASTGWRAHTTAPRALTRQAFSAL